MVQWLRVLLGGPRSATPLAQSWSFAPGHGAAVAMPVVVHARRSPHVVLMLPGWDGTVDGYAGKYRSIAEHVRSHCHAAVVRTDNKEVPGRAFEQVCRARADALVTGALQRARSICGRRRPRLWLLGFSAGAGAMAAVAADHPEVEKLLLVAPSSDAGHEAILASMAGFRGELYVVVGDQDDVVRDLPHRYAAAATQAARRELVVVADCDHQFRGGQNGRILAQAPLWAFAGDGPFPDATRGPHLYD